MNNIQQVNKLVRDKIPEILLNNNSAFELSTCTDTKQYREKITDKLIEEAEEVKESMLAGSKEYTIKELADLLEVIHACIQLMGIDMDKVENARLEKLNTHGGFNKQFILSWYEENRK